VTAPADDETAPPLAAAAVDLDASTVEDAELAAST